MADIEKIRNLLGTGLSAEVVASAVGVSPSYISQLLGQEDFRDSVTNLRIEALSENTERDKQINHLEDCLLTDLQDKIESGMIYKPKDLLQAFAVINRATRRGAQINPNTAPAAKISVLMLPPVLIKQFVLNAKSEVVEIEGQSMTTMPTQQLVDQLINDPERGDKFKEISKYLPSGVITHEADTEQKLRPVIDYKSGLAGAVTWVPASTSGEDTASNVEDGRPVI